MRTKQGENRLLKLSPYRQSPIPNPLPVEKPMISGYIPGS